jgi:hypothetical protein
MSQYGFALPNEVAHPPLDRDEPTTQNTANRKWSLHPMGDQARAREPFNMHRTRRQDRLVGHVRIAMSRRDARRTAASGNASATRWPRQIESEHMARWENEGGALGHGAGQR